MISEDEVVLLVEGLDRAQLRAWVRSGWIEPVREESRLLFAEIDIARVRFIHEIRHELSCNDEAVPVILSLLDQIYGLRRELRQLASAIEAQPEPVRRGIAEYMRRARTG